MKNEKSILNNLPRAMPAFSLAKTLSKRASSVGFDWNDNEEVLKKIYEELNELEEAMLISPEAMEEELGDVLFTLVNFSRRIGVDPEQALSMACEKFISRFNGMEKMTLADGIKLTDLSSAEFELLWQQQKNKAPNF